MASYLRKCLALGYGVLEGPGHPQSLDYRSNRPEFGAPYATYASDNTFFIADTGTRWVRLQVNLSRLWPTETGMDVGQRDQLDRQLAMARHYGCRTIVELGRFYPPWLNGSTDPQVRPTARHMAYGVGNVGDRDGA